MPTATYRDRAAAFAAEEKRLARISFRFSVGRGALFLGFVASLVMILVRASVADSRLWLLAGAWLVAFLLVLPWHDRIIRRQRRAGAAHTPAGRLRLAGWLLQPAAPVEIARRQEAVGELASRAARVRIRREFAGDPSGILHR